MKLISSLTLFLSFTLIFSCTSLEEKPAILPIEDFFKNPEKINFQISPNGRYYSFLAPWNYRMNLFVTEIDKDTTIQITFETDRDISKYIWANDFRILFINDKGGDENYRLYGVNINGSNLKCLTCIGNVRANLIDALVDYPDEVIVGLNKRDPQVFDPYKLNIVTGEYKLLAENPGNIVGWMTDHNGMLRVAQAILPNGDVDLLYRDDENEPFESILKTPWKDSFDPFFFTFDNKMLYAISNIGRDKKEVVVFDPKSQSEVKVLYKNSLVDVDIIRFSKKRRVLTSAEYYDDKKEIYFFDKKTEELYQKLAEIFPDKSISVNSASLDEDKFIVRTYSDKTRGKYYLFNTENEKIEKIAEVSPWIDEQQMADMKPIQYESRDGLTIHGYLTVPKGVQQKKLPTVILPHGGPWLRDVWEFDPEVQFLANRGYAVLQMNFRGSTGYGKEFWFKSIKQWGKDMQNDVTDGVYWLINEGVADRDRIAIYGASFGGYVALAGAAFTPDLYACAVDYVGVSSMFTFMETIPPYWEPLKPQYYAMVGDPVEDSALFAEISPLLHADNIKIPLFIAQGTNDPRVNKNESDQMVKALRDRGIEVEYMVKENEGHGFLNEENRLEFYRNMEQFLAKNLQSISSENK
ncbi:MAG: S9 family peptidase [Bacteroidales bacterium]|nr:S9 family peptidase [Bacteroidales bacterium]MBN2820189.1 S9 family peptidase [Bacteroidales bacterium]